MMKAPPALSLARRRGDRQKAEAPLGILATLRPNANGHTQSEDEPGSQPFAVGSFGQRQAARLWSAFTRPTPALPIDCFRGLVGLLSCGYFVRTVKESATISVPDGLIDH